MTDVNAPMVRFQCPKCGHELEQAKEQLRSSERMSCPNCGVGINIDANRLANAVDEFHKATDRVPPEITIKFFR
jgi:transcription elongation factor Elf1